MINNKPPKTLSFLTFNTLGTPFFAPDITKRIHKTGELINKGSYDIVCLQEVFTYYQLLLFRKKLTNYQFSYYQKNPFGPGGGLVIFSRYPLRSKTFFPYSQPSGIPVPFFTRLARPGILSAIIEPFNIRVATTHLSSDNVYNLSPKSRLYNLLKSQSQEAAAFVNGYIKRVEPIIVAGDFNIPKDSDLYKNFLRKTNAVNVYDEKKAPVSDPNRTGSFYRSDENLCDYFFIIASSRLVIRVSTGYALDKQEILSNSRKSYLSDHIGLHCILEVNK